MFFMRDSKKLAYESDLIYEKAVFACVHSGQPRVRGAGRRPDQHYLALGCPAKIRLLNKNSVLKITVLELNHNHEISKSLQKFYPKNRQFDLKSKEKIIELDKHQVPRGIIRNIMLGDNNGKFCTVKDITNVLTKMKPPSTQKENILVQKALEDIKVIDPDATVIVRTDEQNQVESILIATSGMKENFKKFGQMIFLDSTYKINVENFSLYCFLIQDSLSFGQPVAISFLSHESKYHMRQLLTTFQDLYKNSTEIKTFMVDKDFIQMNLLINIFPTSRVLLCYFHVVKKWREVIARLPITVDEKKLILRAAKRVLYSIDEATHECNIEQLKNVSSHTEFDMYFRQNWLNCKEQWIFYMRKNITTLLNNTNNRIESFYAYVKRTFRQRNCIPHMGEAIEILMKMLHLKSDTQQYRNFTQSLTVYQKNYNHNHQEFLNYCGRVLSDKACDLINNELIKMDTGTFVIDEEEDKENDNIIITNSTTTRTYETKPNKLICSCYFNSTTSLPCCHILMYLKKNDGLNSINENLIQQRWLRNMTIHSDAIPVVFDDYSNNLNEITLNDSTDFNMTKVLTVGEKHKEAWEVFNQIQSYLTTLGTDDFYQRLSEIKELHTKWTKNKR
ncbi:unnamed protein product [Didymodactylos carnosus]|uniref:SWIM-type domain-containing protein n=3 Tax=Didymodactylos carnosus TaxID=1234261 RepID=A0A815JQ41_9BILA|nr:unnamed protein product [Didymodactylos carnosus]CAF4273263.1 unnamed protein product [Didymodactylos carnosus]